MPERPPEFLTIQQAAALTRLSRAVFEPYESKAQPGMVEFDVVVDIHDAASERLRQANPDFRLGGVLLFRANDAYAWRTLLSARPALVPHFLRGTFSTGSVSAAIQKILKNGPGEGTLKISVDPDPYPWPSSSAVPIPLPVNEDVEVPVA